MIYEIEFKDTCDTVNKIIADAYASSGAMENSRISWAVDNAKDLCILEQNLYNRIEAEWCQTVAIKKYQTTLIEWGRTILKIYKQYEETR